MPVWHALSALFIDTEITPEIRAHIAKICAASPYSVAELERILFDEVWSALGVNLLAVAGEHRGWDEDTVRNAVLQKYRSKWRFPWRYHPFKHVLAKDWSALKVDITRIRDGNLS